MKDQKKNNNKKNNNNKSSNTKAIIIFIILVIIIILIGVFMVKGGFAIFSSKEDDSTTDPVISSENTSDYGSDYTIGNGSDENENSSSEDENTSESKEDTDDETENSSRNENNDKVYAAALPLTIDDAIAILNSRYGKGYEINSTTAGSGYNNFAVFKDGERYATVSVNLSTGDATEYITSTGKQTKFNLL